MKRLSINGAEALANKMRVYAGISLTEPVNIKTLLRKMGIQAMYRPMSEESYGICIKTDIAKFILVNSNTTRGRQHFTIAHELFHLFFDENPRPHICGVSTDPVEKDANLFASALLMPREGLYASISDDELRHHKLSISTVLKLEQLYGVSRKAMLCRLKDIGALSEATFKALDSVGARESAIAYGYDTSLYEKGNEGVVIGDFGEKARILFDQGKISEGHYMELLNMWSDDRPES
jgi:Zn-dependent peptidase ImmA (M78 family)